MHFVPLIRLPVLLVDVCFMDMPLTTPHGWELRLFPSLSCLGHILLAQSLHTFIIVVLGSFPRSACWIKGDTKF